MRRALLAVLCGGTLLAAAACDTQTKTTDDAAAPAVTLSDTPEETLPPLPDYSASTKAVCGDLQSVYSGELRAFGTAMGQMVSFKEAKQPTDAAKAEDTAAAQLKAAGADILKKTATAQDPDLKAAGVTTAAKFDESAQNRTYLGKVNTLKDLNSTLKTQMNEWLTPVSGFCESSS